MRIGLITYGLDRPLRGIGRYTSELVLALQVLDTRPEIVLLTAGSPDPNIGPLHLPQYSLPGCRLLPGLLTLGNLVILNKARALGLDLVHDPTGISPFLFGVRERKLLVTLHDVFPWSFPGHNTLLETLIYNYWLPRVINRLDGVLTVSQSSKRDIVKFLKVRNNKIHLISEGVNANYRQYPIEIINQVRSRYKLPDSYILFVGSLESRKNLSRLLQAYALLKSEGVRRPLVVVGIPKRTFTRTPSISDIVKKLDIEQQVKFTGYIPEADLPAIYNAATIFAFPSLYEGFGLPVLEAMACGTPVVTSNVSSLPEVAGDAALLVDPYNVESIASAMQRVLSDAELAAELRAQGLARTRQFTWERTARETLEVYRQVLAGQTISGPE